MSRAALRRANHAVLKSNGAILSSRKASKKTLTTSRAKIKALGSKGHWITYNQRAWKSSYSDIIDRTKKGKNRAFTQAQKARIRQVNRQLNGGVLRDDESGQVLVRGRRHRRGKTPPKNEAQVDHVKPKSKGGTNHYHNARLRSREANRKKSNKW